MQLMPLDLPAPVAPAISRCGVVARSRNTALPAMSLPMATSSGSVAARGLGRHEEVAERDELAGVVGDLDADRRPAWDRGEDAHVGGGHGVGDVALQARDPGDLDAGAELELVAGDRRPDGHADERGLDAVLVERAPRATCPRASTSARLTACAPARWRRSVGGSRQATTGAAGWSSSGGGSSPAGRARRERFGVGGVVVLRRQVVDRRRRQRPRAVGVASTVVVDATAALALVVAIAAERRQVAQRLAWPPDRAGGRRSRPRVRCERPSCATRSG